MNRNRKIQLALIFWLIFGSINNIYASNIIQNKIVKYAQDEIGNGEENKNNCGRYIKLYLKGRENLPWCAGFVSYILNKAGINELGYNSRARDFYYKAKKLNWIIENPEAGDLIVFWRKNKDGNLGHIGIIEKIENNKIISIEGNVGKYPARVKRIIYDKNKIHNLLGYIRIRK